MEGPGVAIIYNVPHFIAARLGTVKMALLLIAEG
jgi:hypothetical protein